MDVVFFKVLAQNSLSSTLTYSFGK